MDREKAQAMLRVVTPELATAQHIEACLQQIKSGLRGLLDGPAVAVPSVDPTSAAVGGERLRPSEAVLSVLRSQPNKLLPFPKIWAELGRQNLVDPTVKSGRNAYTNAARRLATSGKSGVSHEGNAYVYRPAASAPVELLSHPAPDEVRVNDTPRLQAVTS